MQNDVFGCYDEVEPRSMPKPASKFDSRPFPMVPEVSLIMDKPPKSKRMEEPLSHTVPEMRSTVPRDSSNKASETYAAWKEKQFPPHPNRTPPNRLQQVYSPVPHAGSLQDLHGSRQSLKSYNSVDGEDYHYRNQGNESPRRLSGSRNVGQLENPNKYTLSYARNVSTNDHVNAYNHASRSHSRDETGSPSLRRRSDHSRDREIYDSRQNSSPLSRRRADRSHEADSYNMRQRSSSSDRRRPDQFHESENYDMGQRPGSNDRRRSDFSRAIEAYDIRQKPNSHDRRQSEHPNAVEAYDRQKPRLYRSSSYSSADAYSHRSMPTESSCPSKHSRSLQAVKYSPERTHHYQGCCTSNHNTSNSETETVKNLLHVITSQNEQIKNLQKQVERLLKLHEQSLRDKNQCTCQPNGIVYQNAQMYDHCRTTNLPIGSNNLMKDNERCFSELKLQDEKNKQTIVEQKVSIGVMTSFELKVQNNPSLLTDNEMRQKNNADKILPGLETKNMIKNLVNDTGEMIRKKPNFFQPTPLENISEGSESHMSSLRQSHLCPDSTRQSIEAHDSLEVQNSNLCRQNFQENENMQQFKEPTQSNNHSEDKRAKRPTNLEYGIREPPYGRDAVQEQLVYQYNLPYENPRSSDDEDPKERKADEFNAEPQRTPITKMKSTKSDNFADDCLSLSSSELDVEDPSPPSPEPSIHLDMQEYSENGSLPPQRAQKVGWTLYNNVLDQVNQILQNSPMNDDGQDEESPNGLRSNGRKEYDSNVIMDTVKAATLEQLTKLGISFSENMDQREPNYNKRVMFDASYYARQGPEAHMATTSGGIETNTSIHMKALAKKYLNEEQLADMATQKSRVGGLKTGPNNVQNSNMSFATMHYLQRYQLLPGNNPVPARDAVRENYKGPPAPVIHERLAVKAAERREPSPHRYPTFAGNSKVSCPSKILDISTLKQQPKLL
ncbi:uncharacterized protein LOC100680010 [Nasonia vitripennis]|uniref:Uncharacterized protein n=1 Tax=Nasonia vitripennis TaxID=7425 RepID=A0A7M7IZF5_NASVI|nr:uncharacterized protein LOC100680010 [Nasonia vitripennis]